MTMSTRRRCPAVRYLAVACLALAVSFAGDRLAVARKAAPPATPAQRSVQQPANGPAELFALGEKYRWGLDAQIDWTAAAKSYAEAARQGHAEAMTRLGLMYELGAGVPYDEAHMLDLFRGAAELGNAAAMTQLGRLRCKAKRLRAADGRRCGISALPPMVATRRA
jgi:TPR repeat protein